MIDRQFFEFFSDLAGCIEIIQKIRQDVFFELKDRVASEITVYYLERSKRIVAAEMM